MLSLLPIAYRLATEANALNGRDDLALHCIQLLADFVSWTAGIPLRNEEEQLSRRRTAARMVKVGFQTTADFIKTAIELSRDRDVERLDQNWESVLEYWDPSSEAIEEWQFEHIVESQGADSADVQAAIDKRRIASELSDVRSDLLGTQLVLRLALVGWTLRMLERRESATDVAIFKQLGSRFGDLESACRAVDIAREIEHADRRVPWLRWTEEDRLPGRGYSVSAEIDLSRVMLVMALQQFNPTTLGRLPARDWIRLRREELIELIANLSSRRDLWDRFDLSEPEIELRAAALSDAVNQAANEQQRVEEDQLVAMPISTARVNELVESLQRAWSENTLARDLFRVSDRVRAQTILEDGLFALRDQLLPKGFFTDLPQYVGTDMTGANLGNGLARAETRLIVSTLTAVEKVQSTADQFRNDAAEAIRSLLEGGGQPSFGLIPENLGTAARLGIPYMSDLSIARPDWRVGNLTRRAFAGLFDGVPMFRCRAVDQPIAIFVDADRALEILVSPAVDASPEVDVLEVDEARARELATASNDLGRRSAADSIAEREARIRLNVLVRVHERIKPRLIDPRAVRVIVAQAENLASPEES